MKVNKCKDCISDKCESKILIERINTDISKEIITRHCGLYKSEKNSNLNNILNEIAEAWKETKEHFNIEGKLHIKIKEKNSKDKNLEI